MSVSQPRISIRPSFHFGFCGFYFKLIRKLSTEELVFVIETIVLLILRHPKSDFSYSLMILLGNIIEHLKENSIISPDTSNRNFFVAEEALVHGLLTVVTDASCIDLKIEALKQYVRYLSKLLVGSTDEASYQE